MSIEDAIKAVVEHQHLRQAEAFAVASAIMEGGITPAQIASLLTALRMKGETVEEVLGFAQAMREKVTPVAHNCENLVDTCGTGGDRHGTFNISTTAAFVAAGAGCSVAKHGNRAVSSQSGSADMLKALDVNIDISAEKMAACLAKTGIAFLFAPNLHPAMKHVAGPRREMGIRTIFNVLGPLTNPAGAKRQLIGVYEERLLELVADVLLRLEATQALVAYSEDGLDELSICGKTTIAEIKNGRITLSTVTPEEFGLPRHPLSAIKGGNAQTNAAIALAVLQGQAGAARDIVLLNAGAVIYVAGKAATIQAGLMAAVTAIDSGAAMRVLEQFRQFTNA